MWPFKCKCKIYSSIDSMSWYNPKDMPYNMAIVYRCNKCGAVFYSHRAAFVQTAGSQDDYSNGSKTKLDRSYMPITVKRLQKFYGKYFDISDDKVNGKRIA